MLTYCNQFTAWIEKTLIEPMETWVSQQQQKCAKKGWLGKLFCWFIVILVKVVIWVVKKILVPVVKTVCCVVSFVVGSLALPFVAWSPKLTKWFKTKFFCTTKCKYLRRETLTGQAYKYRYHFECECANPTTGVTTNSPFAVEANDDVEAAEKLRNLLAAQNC